MLIPAYYERLDGAAPFTALELVDPDIRFLIVVPSAEIGGGYDELRAYIARRPTDVERRHLVLRSSRDGDVESVYGQVTEHGRSIGSFTAVGRVGSSGLLSHYQVFFRTDFGLLPPVS